MAQDKNVAIMSYNAKILNASDGKRQKVANSADKTSWIPASAGMTTHVGGNSH
jgi:hypothetical protein